MMRRVFSCARDLAAAMALALSIVACFSDDAAAPAIDASADVVAVDLCAAFTSNGAECPAASRTVCFPECATGGCSCTATAAGPRWKCVTDLSCLPDARPVDFDAQVNEPDATADATNGSDGGASDGADGGATADARADASD